MHLSETEPLSTASGELLMGFNPQADVTKLWHTEAGKLEVGRVN